MNAYADLTTLKSSSYLNITGTGDDTYLRQLLEDASRILDKVCKRHFYTWEGTKYQDGCSGKLFFVKDVLSITTLKTDDGGDGTFENSWTENTDFILYPLNGFPKLYAALGYNGSYQDFAAGIPRGVEIDGVFGHGDGESATPYSSSGVTVTADDATETTLDVSAEGTIAPGHTILVESEQIYVTAATSDGSNEITVKRAVNGTTGAAHAAKTASIYEYPMPIIEACLITSMRAWKRKDSAYVDILGNPETGQIPVIKGLDPDVKERVSGYMKLAARFA